MGGRDERPLVSLDDHADSSAAPGVVRHERGARNETDERVVFTASRCPLPS